MGYIIERSSSIVTITETEDSNIFVTVFVQASCNENEWVVSINEQEITAVNKKLVITLPSKDGVYKLLITDKDTIEDEVIYLSYNELLKSFVEDVKNLLCDCPCKSCKDCGKKETEYSSTILKLLSYNIINENKYNTNLASTNDCIKCLVLDANKCILRNEFVTGVSENSTLLKQIIAYYYLVFYYTDVAESNSPEIIKTNYQYINILPCIKKLGIDFTCIKDILDPTGIFSSEFSIEFE